MKPTINLKLLFLLLWIIGLSPLGLSESYAQGRSGTRVRGRQVEPTKPNPLDTPSPAPSTNPSPAATATPSPTVADTSSPDASPTTTTKGSTRPVLLLEPKRPESITLPSQVETQPRSGTEPQSNTRDPDLERSYKEALMEYYSSLKSKNQASSKSFEYNNWALEHRKNVFAWQLNAGKVIFIVVLLLVLTGVFFSGIQFFIAMKQVTRRGKVSEASDVKEDEALLTTLKATLNGIEVSSSILGVIILMVSFLFFYLYLVYVYPIAAMSQ